MPAQHARFFHVQNVTKWSIFFLCLVSSLWGSCFSFNMLSRFSSETCIFTTQCFFALAVCVQVFYEYYITIMYVKNSAAASGSYTFAENVVIHFLQHLEKKVHVWTLLYKVQLIRAWCFLELNYITEVLTCSLRSQTQALEKKKRFSKLSNLKTWNKLNWIE